MENGPLIGPVTFAPLEKRVTYLRSLNDDDGDPLRYLRVRRAELQGESMKLFPETNCLKTSAWKSRPLALKYSLETHHRRRRRYKPLGERHQCG